MIRFALIVTFAIGMNAVTNNTAQADANNATAPHNGTAQQEHKHDHDHQHEHQHAGGEHADGATGMDEKAMADFQKMGAPGEHHQNLNAFVGNWSVEGKMRFGPDQPWMPSNSVCTGKWVHGKRFVTHEFVGDPVMGSNERFEGFGILGYDNFTKKYTSVWIDNMSTTTMVGEGSCSSDGKTITLMSRYVHPFTGSPTYLKSVFAVDSPTQYTLRLYEPAMDGTEYNSMELVHKKK